MIVRASHGILSLICLSGVLTLTTHIANCSRTLPAFIVRGRALGAHRVAAISQVATSPNRCASQGLEAVFPSLVRHRTNSMRSKKSIWTCFATLVMTQGNGRLRIIVGQCVDGSILPYRRRSVSRSPRYLRGKKGRNPTWICPRWTKRGLSGRLLETAEELNRLLRTIRRRKTVALPMTSRSSPTELLRRLNVPYQR
jgi:hypothetical protein